jgi:hypothetical protein
LVVLAIFENILLPFLVRKALPMLHQPQAEFTSHSDVGK